jgi:hypothetical protein
LVHRSPIVHNLAEVATWIPTSKLPVKDLFFHPLKLPSPLTVQMAAADSPWGGS